MRVFMIYVPIENSDAFSSLCQCLEWDWYNFENVKGGCVRIPDNKPMMRIFEALDGSIYTIAKEK